MSTATTRPCTCLPRVPAAAQAAPISARTRRRSATASPVSPRARLSAKYRLVNASESPAVPNRLRQAPDASRTTICWLRSTASATPPAPCCADRSPRPAVAETSHGSRGSCWAARRSCASARASSFRAAGVRRRSAAEPARALRASPIDASTDPISAPGATTASSSEQPFRTARSPAGVPGQRSVSLGAPSPSSLAERNGGARAGGPEGAGPGPGPGPAAATVIVLVASATSPATVRTRSPTVKLPACVKPRRALAAPGPSGSAGLSATP